jgi:Tfp pilus assembly protein FimT
MYLEGRSLPVLIVRDATMFRSLQLAGFNRSENDEATLKRRGFSMIDTIVTVLLLGIMSAVTVPRMSESLERYRLRSAANVLAEQLEYLRRQAIVRGHDLTVELRSRPASVRCSQISMPNRVGVSFVVDLEDSYQIQKMAWSGFDGTELRFDRHGNAFSGAMRIESWSIQIRNASAIATLAITANDTQVTVQ